MKEVKPSKEWIIDGYSGFLLLDKNGNSRVAMHIEHHFQWALKKFRKLHPDKPLPKITAVYEHKRDSLRAAMTFWTDNL